MTHPIPSSMQGDKAPLRHAGQCLLRALADASVPPAASLTEQALRLRSKDRYALHPVETSLRHHRAEPQTPGEKGDGSFDFESAESLYRAGTQGLRLSKIPQFPEHLRELSRLTALDREGCTYLRRWVEASGPLFDERAFVTAWESQGRRGGAEHHVYHDQILGRWFKRLYHGVNHATLGDYFVRMRMHAALFPETAYRLEGFTINAKSKTLAPVVSQPHVVVDTSRPPVSKPETDALLADMGFAPVQLFHNGIRDDGYFAYLHPLSGILAHDLHDENVVRVSGTDELAVIDPHISLARRGSWAAIKLAEIGLPPPPDDDLVIPPSS